MKRALIAYGWWAAGVLSAIALAWAYHRRIAGGMNTLEPDHTPAADEHV